jgi:hypothetical protein
MSDATLRALRLDDNRRSTVSDRDQQDHSRSVPPLLETNEQASQPAQACSTRLPLPTRSSHRLGASAAPAVAGLGQIRPRPPVPADPRIAPVAESGAHPTARRIGRCIGARRRPRSRDWRISGLSRSMRSRPASATPRVRRRRLLGLAGDRNRGGIALASASDARPLLRRRPCNRLMPPGARPRGSRAQRRIHALATWAERGAPSP